MNKKGGYGTLGTIVIIVLGLIVLALIIGGPIKTAYEFAKEKLFGEQGIFSVVRPSKEEEFIPYTYSMTNFVLPGDKEKALDLLVDKTIECWKDYRKYQSHMRCFRFDIDIFNFSIIINEDDFENALKARGPEVYDIQLIQKIWPGYNYHYKWNIAGGLISVPTNKFYMCANRKDPFGDLASPMGELTAGDNLFITQDLEGDCPVEYLR
ncbi:hypothetical protein JW851_00355 [Candidatus Woesearchaeota archaeon]|nr:hypothetical protein [Candidatus Woesearchaeota archaeon]